MNQVRILVIGGGILGNGMDLLSKATNVALIETDVYIGPRTQIVCDAHHLPFKDGVFDAVVAQAVLEHVIDPQAVSDEIRRVLRPGGLVYSEIPFMFPVHEGAFDFTRYTLSGHRMLFSWFDDIDSGLLGGPGSALALSIQYYVRCLPRRSGWFRSAVVAMCQIALWWLPKTDRYLNRREAAQDAASGTYFMGRLRPEPRSDKEIVNDYAGSFRSTPLR